MWRPVPAQWLGMLTLIALLLLVTLAPTFALWAPTARSVKLNVFPESGAAVSVDMVEDGSSGVWSYTATDASWVSGP